MPEKNTLNDDIIEEEDEFEELDQLTIDDIEDIDYAIHPQIEDDDENKEEIKPNNEEINNSQSYEVIYNHGLKEGEKPLERVIGHQNQKQESYLTDA